MDHCRRWMVIYVARATVSLAGPCSLVFRHFKNITDTDMAKTEGSPRLRQSRGLPSVLWPVEN